MNQIKSSAQDVNQATHPGEDDLLGSGRINAQNALTLALPPTEEEKAQVTIDYTYDANGNQTQKSIQIGQAKPSLTDYTYDFENHLIAITSVSPQGAVPVSSYTYDGLGKRIQSMEEGKTTQFLYDGLNAILERNSTNTTQASYTRGLSYGGGIGGILSSLRGSQTSHYHYDGLGSVTDLTDSNDKTIQTYEYDAFGNTLTSTGNTPNPYRFSTKESSPSDFVTGIGGRVPCYVYEVEITIGPHSYQTEAQFLPPVELTSQKESVREIPPLLGRRNTFVNFKIVFDEANQELELIPYPQ